MHPLDALALVLFACSGGIMVAHAIWYRRRVVNRRRAARGLPPILWRKPRYRRTPNPPLPTDADPYVERFRSSVRHRR